MFFWIGILAGMSKNIFGFNWLAACVAAVVSESKKAVSAVAAAVVGIGLFLAPMEKAQAQGHRLGTVTQVDLDSFSFIVAGDLDMSISFDFGSAFAPVFHWSGIYWGDSGWTWKSIDGGLENFLAGYVSVLPFQVTPYYYPGSRSDYYVCRFGPVGPVGSGLSIDESAGWVEVWVWTGTATHSPSAYVYDSDGNSYDVDLAIDGYVISGPSLD